MSLTFTRQRERERERDIHRERKRARENIKGRPGRFVRARVHAQRLRDKREIRKK